MTNKGTANTYKISILVSRDGFSFCGQNKKEELVLLEQKFFTEEKTSQNLLKSLQSFLEHTAPFSVDEVEEVRIIYANQLFSVVPQKLFDEKNLTDYLKFNIKLLQTDFIAYDALSKTAANIVFVPYANINNYLFDTFGEFTYSHSIGILIESSLTTKPTKKTVFINFYKSFFEVCCIQEEKLLFCNSFAIETPEDFMYYLLFCFEQFELSQEETPVILSGSIEKDSENYKILSTYIRNIDFAETPEFKKAENAQLTARADYTNYLLLNSL